MKRLNKYFYLIVYSFSILILLSACSLFPKEDRVISPPLVKPADIDYDVTEVKRGTIIDSLAGNAKFAAVTDENYFYEQPGARLDKIHVINGESVEKGEILAEVDSGNLANDIAQLEIEYQKADIRVKQLKFQEADEYSIHIAELDKEALELHLTQLRKQLANTKLTSSITGDITFISDAKPGEEIEPYQSLVQVAETNNLQLKYIGSSTRELSKVKIGMNVNVTFGGEDLSGTVVQTPETVPADVTGEEYDTSILINLNNPPDELKVGDTARVEVIVSEKANTLIIPKNGLRTVENRHYVQVLDNNTKREKDVEIGIISETEVEILKGVKEGEIIILE